MKHAPRTMELGTMCKVVGVLVLLMVLIAGVFSTCFHVLRNRDKRRETFANPANPMTPSVQKVSADDLQFFETDAETRLPICMTQRTHISTTRSLICRSAR